VLFIINKTTDCWIRTIQQRTLAIVDSLYIPRGSANDLTSSISRRLLFLQPHTGRDGLITIIALAIASCMSAQISPITSALAWYSRNRHRGVGRNLHLPRLNASRTVQARHLCHGRGRPQTVRFTSTTDREALFHTPLLQDSKTGGCKVTHDPYSSPLHRHQRGDFG
jgi:hypothetical protein